MRKVVPDRGPLPVLVPGALDLVGGRGDPPVEQRPPLLDVVVVEGKVEVVFDVGGRNGASSDRRVGRDETRHGLFGLLPERLPGFSDRSLDGRREGSREVDLNFFVVVGVEKFSVEEVERKKKKKWRAKKKKNETKKSIEIEGVKMSLFLSFSLLLLAP